LSEIKALAPKDAESMLNDVMRARGFVFPSGGGWGGYSDAAGMAGSASSLCPHCWSRDFGFYLDDESIMGMGREWSVYCKRAGCGFSLHGI